MHNCIDELYKVNVDKMGKEDKKSSVKKSKSDHSHKSKDKKSSKSRDDRGESGVEFDCRQMSILLTGLIIDYPQLLGDLPSMIYSMDNGECVNVRGISNYGMKMGLIELFSLLPNVEETSNGFMKVVDAKKSVSGFLLNGLLDVGAIIQPTDLDSYEQTASRNAPLLLIDLLKQFPDLKHEFSQLLEQILDGTSVQLDSLPNEDLIAGLEKILSTFGLEESDEGYSLPSSSKLSRPIEHVIEHFLEIFHIYDKYKKVGNKWTQAVESTKKTAEQQAATSRSSRRDADSEEDNRSSAGSNSSTDESHSNAEKEDEWRAKEEQALKAHHANSSSNSYRNHNNKDEEEGDNDKKKRMMQGPSIPTQQELLHALSSMQSYHDQAVISSEDEEDDGYGPVQNTRKPPVTTSEMMIHTMPLGYVGHQFPTATSSSSVDAIPAVDAEKNVDPNEREEWLLTPGTCKALDGKIIISHLILLYYIPYRFQIIYSFKWSVNDFKKISNW